MIKSIARKVIILIVATIVAVIASVDFYTLRHTYDSFVPAESLIRVTSLSEYEPSLKGTYGDSPVYIFDSGIEGGTLFFMGGTHPNESAGILSSYLLMETLELRKGRIIVLPIANYSASTTTLSGYGYPSYYHIDTPWGKKRYKIGSRATSPLDQWPDPPIFIQYPSGQRLSYEDSRNSNRNYPGRDNGFLTERVGKAIMNLLEKESVSLAFDMHEASITYPVNDTFIVPEKYVDIAFLSSMAMEADGIPIRVEISSESNRGYSHFEWGNIDGVYPFLIEVPTPFIERVPAMMTEDLILTGKDDFVLSLAKRGFSSIEYNEEGYPLEVRCGIHLTGALTVLSLANQFLDIPPIDASWVGYHELVENGIGYYLKNPNIEENINRVEYVSVK